MTEDAFWLIETMIWIAGLAWPAYWLARKNMVLYHARKMQGRDHY